MSNLIHVGDLKLSQETKDRIKKGLDSIDPTEVFNVITLEDTIDKEIISREEADNIVKGLYTAMNEFGMDKLSTDGKTPIIKLAGIAEISFYRQNPGRDTDWGFDANKISNLNKVVTAYWNLNEIDQDGEIEFLYQEIAVRPSDNEVIVFPAGFSHAHRLLGSSIPKYFIKTSFYIGS